MSPTKDALRPARALITARSHCLGNAEDLINSAKLILDAGGAHNVAFHLSVLALEEIGKAGMLLAQAATGRGDDFFAKKLDDHIWKLQWAIWSASMRGHISPNDFEEARQFAKVLHTERLASLYVDPDQAAVTVIPKDAITSERANVVFKLATARLQMEERDIEPVDDDDDLKWFIAATENDDERAKLFSSEFIAQHAALEGDTKAWVRWARNRMGEIREEERAYTDAQLARIVSPPEEKKPKWRIKVNLQTRTLTIRPKSLNVWNAVFKDMQLSPAAGKTALNLHLTLYDDVPLQRLWDTGLSLSVRIILMLNVGTTNVVWFEFPSQDEKFFEEITDLENARMRLKLENSRSLKAIFKQSALTDPLIDNCIKCVLTYWPLDNETAEPIFGSYLQGVRALSKRDIHVATEKEARSAFLVALRAAAVQFGNWDGSEAALHSCVSEKVDRIISTEEAKQHLLNILDSKWESAEGALIDAAHAKLLCDLFLLQHARDNFKSQVEQLQTAATPEMREQTN